MIDQHGAVGSRVIVKAPGVFHGYAGTIARITQHGSRGPLWYWVVFEYHPWQRPGVDWSFSKRELETA